MACACVWPGVSVAGSGDIDFDEFVAYWKSAAPGQAEVSREHLRALFDKFDANGGGKLQQDEFGVRSWVSTLRPLGLGGRPPNRLVTTARCC